MTCFGDSSDSRANNAESDDAELLKKNIHEVTYFFATFQTAEGITEEYPEEPGQR